MEPRISRQHRAPPDYEAEETDGAEERGGQGGKKKNMRKLSIRRNERGEGPGPECEKARPRSGRVLAKCAHRVPDWIGRIPLDWPPRGGDVAAALIVDYFRQNLTAGSPYRAGAMRRTDSTRSFFEKIFRGAPFSPSGAPSGPGAPSSATAGI